jgi:hypothetical protein
MMASLPRAAFRLKLERPLQLVHIDFRHGFRQSPRRAIGGIAFS